MRRINGRVENGPIKIHSMGTIMQSYEDAIRICMLTGTEVTFLFNNKKYSITEGDLEIPSDELAAMLYRLNIRPKVQ